MPRKTKSKQRLDKYYNLAKDQGYRSRAAFKLFQLNKKYNFLNQATVVVDLCAAPGGWMQVCSQLMPVNSTIVGLDLVSIKGIPGCKAFQMDITRPECHQLLKRELPKKADVFLHDGAPNVGASWTKDAYNQNDLVLSSLHLATQFLRKGGTFVTKVFRSADYNSLMYVFNKFFQKVEATKPLASRFVSAEIFVVCMDYLDPQYVDEKLFDSKFVFKENETDIQGLQMQKEIVSLDKLMEKRGNRHRGGYADDVHQSVYQAIPFEEFMKKQNPFPIFLEYNSIKMTDEDKKKYLPLTKPPQDIEILLDDIKVLGKREIGQLLKWRSKIKHVLDKNSKVVNQEQEFGDFDNVENQEFDQEEDDIEDLVEKQQMLVNEDLIKKQKSELKEQRKLKQKRFNQEKKLVGKGSDAIVQDDTDNIIEILKGQNLDDDYIEPEPEQVQKSEKKKQLKFKDQEQLDKNLELIYENSKQRKQVLVEKAQVLRQSRKPEQERYDVDDDQIACKPLKNIKKQKEPEQIELTSKFFERDIFDNLKEQLNESQTFNNPLKNKQVQVNKIKEPKQKQQQVRRKPSDDSDNSDNDDEEMKPKNMGKLQQMVQNDLDDIYVDVNADDQDYERRLNIEINQDAFPDEDEKVERYKLNVPLSEMEMRRKKLKKLAKREERKLKRNQDDDPNKQALEVVPAKKLEDYDIDELATNLVLAKKMLRKKTREQIIDNSFGVMRTDDHDELPTWFTEDEKRHCYKTTPISKEEFQLEKQRLMEINARVPKKIMEAKIRKYKKAQKKMKKAAAKAQQVFDTDGLNERTKMEQVRKIYKKEENSLNKEKKKDYIVSRKGQVTSGKRKSSRNVALVDKRLKKDKRAQKARDKKVGKGKKRRHVSRRQKVKSKA